MAAASPLLSSPSTSLLSTPIPTPHHIRSSKPTIRYSSIPKAKRPPPLSCASTSVTPTSSTPLQPSLRVSEGPMHPQRLSCGRLRCLIVAALEQPLRRLSDEQDMHRHL
ncbi:uncharacterized protein LOC133887373 [Phragmites australis]|uniref:uncharacterized protein LOC133887373 n=1 Tax=Phragmites australis TaxID=29695 RepID=UPI002D780F04|nr:uncharacterized protein LOC133887373 [Phragmites australis]